MLASDENVCSLLYTSKAAVTLDDFQMLLLLRRSRELNARNRITGILLYVRVQPPQLSYYVQLLEGQEAAVRSTYDRIRRDGLHDSLVVLGWDHPGRRRFPGWSMRHVELDADQFARLDVVVGEGVSHPVAQWIRNVDSVEAVIGFYELS